MTTTTGPTTVAEPVVHHRLRRRPPAGIRNGRALLMAIAGYGIIVLFVVVLGTLIGIKGADGALALVAVIALPLAAFLLAVTRLTKRRTKWSYLLAVLTVVAIALVVGFLVVTMGDRMDDPNAVFFAQLFLFAPLVLSIAAAGT